ncbi:SGNH/GDSL hydrolase family protein [Mycobacterium avium]|uniref:SGNH/GDSL hydrolase family protein n=1 Tax=Mycobacterium avium TaxID=1764 RepID=UPI001CC7155D|nr:SGNH/GDSL hydrolase family protein [Mycobacterium avium]MBZ4522632.1 SGNH/GDSL hydrolase family protein [Mycobacterium avium subsp. hominissuis]
MKLASASLLRTGSALAASLAFTCTAVSSASAQPAPKQLKYVAMGDSYAAAPLVPEPAPPLGCGKSTNDYPSVLARRLAPGDFTDVTCGGATTNDIMHHVEQTPAGPVPSQIDAVSSDTTLITVSIGGADIGLWPIVMHCRASSPDAAPCTDQYRGEGDQLSARIDAQVPAWAAMIDALKAKAPNARIIIVGYGTYMRPEGCFPEQPILPQDGAYLQSKIDEIDDRQKELAVDKKIEYFDTRPLTIGHDVCAPPDDRYIEGYTVMHPALPLHPNASGEAAIGNALADDMR